MKTSLDKKVAEKSVEITKTILWNFSMYFYLTIHSTARKVLEVAFGFETFGFIWKSKINRMTSLPYRFRTYMELTSGKRIQFRSAFKWNEIIFACSLNFVTAREHFLFDINDLL